MSASLQSRFVAALRAADLRPTRARLLLLEALSDHADRWMNIDEIYKLLVQRGTQVSLGAIYNAVKAMRACGILLRERHDSLNGGRSVYIVNPHPRKRGDVCHSVCIACRQCGACAFVQGLAVRDELRASAASQRIRSSDRHITILVTCDACSTSRHGRSAHAAPDASSRSI